MQLPHEIAGSLVDEDVRSRRNVGRRLGARRRRTGRSVPGRSRAGCPVPRAERQARRAAHSRSRRRPKARKIDLQIGLAHRAACSRHCDGITSGRILFTFPVQRRHSVAGRGSGKGLGCNCVIRPLTLITHKKILDAPVPCTERTQSQRHTHTHCTRTRPCTKARRQWGLSAQRSPRPLALGSPRMT